MILSERWMRKVKEYELQIQMKRIMIEAKKLEHNLNIFRMEHEERKERTAYELSLKLEKQLKRKSCYECRNYGHLAIDCTNRDMIFQEEDELLMNFFPKEHGVEVDQKMGIDPYPSHDLFHDAPFDHGVCELNDPPIYDSYELEDDDLSSMSTLANGECSEADLKPFCAIFGQHGADSLEFEFNLVWDELNEAIPPICNELKCSSSETDLIGQHVEDSPSILSGEDSLLIEGTKSGVERGNSGLIAPKLNLNSPIAAPNGLNHTNSLLSLAIHNQPMLQESFVAPMSNILSVTSSEQSRENSFKNCYIFEKRGLHSVQASREDADLQRVHLDQAFSALELNMNQHQVLKQILACANTFSGHHELTIRILRVFGFGLLDYYIEDDELKDARRLLLLHSASQGSRLQDLRSNLHQPGVYDAGASGHVSSKIQPNAMHISSELKRIIKELKSEFKGPYGLKMILRTDFDVP